MTRERRPRPLAADAHATCLEIPDLNRGGRRMRRRTEVLLMGLRQTEMEV
jgi:hypothetical protein